MQWYTNMFIIIDHPNSRIVDNRGQHQKNHVKLHCRRSCTAIPKPICISQEKKRIL